MTKPPLDRIMIIVGSLFLTFLATGITVSFGFGAVEGVEAHGLSVAALDEMFDLLPNTLIFATLMAFMAMLLTGLPLLAVIVWAEVKRVRSVWVHLGFAVAFTVLFSPLAALGESGGEWAEFIKSALVLLVSACVGALTYWALSGRNAGRWQHRST